MIVCDLHSYEEGRKAAASVGFRRNSTVTIPPGVVLTDFNTGMDYACEEHEAKSNLPPDVRPLVEGVKDPNAGTYADKASQHVGDVNSNARGSGARYNSNKAKVQYIPMNTLFRAHAHMLWDGELAHVVAELVSEFEAGDNEAIERALFRVFCERGFAETCDVFDFGAKKYVAWNWAKGMAWSVPLSCIKRHWLSIAKGEEIDPESGLPHWGHLGCNLVMLVHYIRYFAEGDDRPPAVCFEQVVTMQAAE